MFEGTKIASGCSPFNSFTIFIASELESKQIPGSEPESSNTTFVEWNMPTCLHQFVFRRWCCNSNRFHWSPSRNLHILRNWTWDWFRFSFWLGNIGLLENARLSICCNLLHNLMWLMPQLCIIYFVCFLTNSIFQYIYLYLIIKIEGAKSSQFRACKKQICLK